MEGTASRSYTTSKSNKITPVSADDSSRPLQQQIAQLQNELESGKQQNAQVQQQLESSQQQVAQLQQQLESSQQQVAQLQQQLENGQQQNAQLQSEPGSEAQLLEAASNVSTSHATFAKCCAGIVSGKHRRCEQYLRDVFDRYKDASGGLSGQSLVQALQVVEAPTIPTCDQEVDDIIKQFDTDSNKTLDFGEFQQVVNETDELQAWLIEKHLPIAADALRPLVGRGSDQLKKLSQLSSVDIDHAAAATCSIIPGTLQELHQELQAAFSIQSQVEADMKSDPSKFNDCYKMACGSISDFHKGLTGRVGMPHLNFKNAMRQEHCERAGCDVEFTTGNYNITTTPEQEWQYSVESVPCPHMGHDRRIIPISELLQRKVSQDAKLREEEVIAIVLYTGPMFQIYNTILRQYPKDKFAIFSDGDNLFSTSIFVLVSAVQKLSRFTRIPLGTLLYRGLGGRVDLPVIFSQIDDKGCSGYAEWGFLSTTSNRDVALGYSGVKERRPKAMVMVIETSSIDRGADISEFSQYPGEKEFLYLPCSFVQRTRQGNGRVQVIDGGLVYFLSVKINLNIKTQTVEELQEQKKSLHMVSARSILPEVKFELAESLELLKRQGFETKADEFSKFCAKALKRCENMVQNHDLCDPSNFANDEIFRSMVNEVFDTRAEVLYDTKVELHKISTCVATLNVAHSDQVTSVAFHPTLPLMATGSDDSTSKIWQLCSDNSAPTCLVTVGHTAIINRLGFVLCVAFHPTMPIWVTSSADKTAKLWRLADDNSSATCVATLEGHRDWVFWVTFHPTLPLLATSSWDSTAKLWRLSPDYSEVTCVATLVGHKRLWYRLWESAMVLSVAFHATAPLLATSSVDRTAKLWRLSPDNSSATCVATLEGHRDWVRSVAFHPTLPLLATGSDDKTAKLWRLSPDYSEAICVATLVGHGQKVRIVAFHPTAPLLATTSNDKTAKLWQISRDNSSATCVATLEGHRDWVRSVAFHPTLPLLATGCRDKTLKMWR
jgi:WD40 repeat protein